MGHIVNMKEEPTMFMKTKDEEKSMLEEPTMSIKTNDLFWLSHDVDEKQRPYKHIKKSVRVRMGGRARPAWTGLDRLGIVAR